MEDKKGAKERLDAFTDFLRREERSKSTVEKYSREISLFLQWLDGRSIDQEQVIQWKHHLMEMDYTPSTINGMLVALNRFLVFIGYPECKVATLKLQRRLFREEKRDLTKEEYMRLIETARSKGKERLALLMETICATGIRVSEVQYITVEAAQQGRAEISLKGKIRTILLPGKLCKKLLKYAKKKKTVSGEIFLTRNGTGLSRKHIWAEMKAICKAAGVAASKVFPHNLRHLFAKTFYRVTHTLPSSLICSGTPVSKRRGSIWSQQEQNTKSCSIVCNWCGRRNYSSVDFKLHNKGTHMQFLLFYTQEDKKSIISQ